MKYGDIIEDCRWISVKLSRVQIYRYRYRCDPVPFHGKWSVKCIHHGKYKGIVTEASLYYDEEYKNYIPVKRSPTYLPVIGWKDKKNRFGFTDRSWKRSKIKKQWMKKSS